MNKESYLSRSSNRLSFLVKYYRGYFFVLECKVCFPDDNINLYLERSKTEFKSLNDAQYRHEVTFVLIGDPLLSVFNKRSLSLDGKHV